MAALVVAWLGANDALAQEEPDDGGLQVGLGLYFDFNDNLFDSDDQKVESWIGRISPEVSFRSAPGPRELSLTYSGDYGNFFDSSDDDYADHELTAGGQFEVGGRGALELSASFAKGHDARGSGSTQGLPPDSPEFPSEPDEFDAGAWTADYTHGREGARGRLTFGIGQSSLEYTNNRQRNQFFDRDDDFASAGLAIGLRDRASFVTEVRYTETDYPVDRPGGLSLDGYSWSFLVGVTWEATARTEGSVRVGTQRRNFYDPGQLDGDWTTSWDVSVRWSPRTFSHFDFVTSRLNEETNGGGDYIDRSVYGVSWTHEWPAGLESELSWDRQENDYVGTSRNQDESEVSFTLRLPQGERVLWEAGVAHRDRDTGGVIDTLDFDGMLYTIGVNLRLIR